jgi:hypothetical protein
MKTSIIVSVLQTFLCLVFSAVFLAMSVAANPDHPLTGWGVGLGFCVMVLLANLILSRYVEKCLISNGPRK